MRSYRHWCPSGCGKSAIYFKYKDGSAMYNCARCDKDFTREQIRRYEDGD